MKNKFLVLLILILVGCKPEGKANIEDKKITLLNGLWKATLDVQDNKKIEFSFDKINDKEFVFKNAEEKINVTEISYLNDSIFIKMPIYDADIRAKILDNNTLSGYYIKQPKNIKVAFNASANYQKEVIKELNVLSGNWEVTFSPNSDDEYKAVGIFNQDNNNLTGTFLTETGDYRFLEGSITNNKFNLNCFDGSHAFLFDGKVNQDSIVNGMFYSGNHYKEPWIAVRNDNFKLSDASKLTYLKDGYDKVEFSFKNLNNKLISLSDDKYKNKGVIIQIMGSWCPNCLDESKFLSDYYKNNKDVEIIALAFELAKTEEKAMKNLNRLKNTLGIEYEILLASLNTRNKKIAAEKLPMLNHILSYPTTIFIDKDKKVTHIHTGFNGPATKNKYDEFKVDFFNYVNEIK